MIKIKNYTKHRNLFYVVDTKTNDLIGAWNTPKQARFKSRMWYMWLTTGDHRYLRREQND